MVKRILNPPVYTNFTTEFTNVDTIQNRGELSVVTATETDMIATVTGRAIIRKIEMATEEPLMEFNLYWDGATANEIESCILDDGSSGSIALSPTILAALGGETTYWRNLVFDAAGADYMMMLTRPIQVKSSFRLSCFHTAGANRDVAWAVRYDVI